MGYTAKSIMATAANAVSARTMLNLIDKWALDEEISKPFDDDVTSDACMVPIQLEWLNGKICELEECPLDLELAFEAAFEAVRQMGEGCVTVNRLKAHLAVCG